MKRNRLRNALRSAVPAARTLACGTLASALWLPLACKEPPPPPPLPAPKMEEKKADLPLELKPEDAGRPPAEAAPKKTTTRKRSTRRGGSLASCCAALRQNAANAPEPTKQYMTTAAATCDMLAAQGKDRSSAVGMLVGALQGAGLPAQCK